MDYRVSKYSNLRNGNYEWLGMDDKELFVENCKEYPNSKSLKYYKENPIEYSFNNYGFRTPDDFNDTEYGNVFLGCSHTMGVGHHLENTWAHKVNKKVGGKFWNLSQGARGIQTDYRLLFAWKDTLKIKNIFHYTVPWPRYEFFDETEMIYLTPHNKNIKPYKWKFFVDILAGEEYCNYNQMVYINAIKGLSQEIGCNYYYLTPEMLEWPTPLIENQLAYSVAEYKPTLRGKLDENDTTLCARDLKHYSVDRLNVIYENMMEYYEEKI